MGFRPNTHTYEYACHKLCSIIAPMTWLCDYALKTHKQRNNYLRILARSSKEKDLPNCHVDTEAHAIFWNSLVGNEVLVKKSGIVGGQEHSWLEITRGHYQGKYPIKAILDTGFSDYYSSVLLTGHQSPMSFLYCEQIILNAEIKSKKQRTELAATLEHLKNCYSELNSKHNIKKRHQKMIRTLRRPLKPQKQ